MTGPVVKAGGDVSYSREESKAAMEARKRAALERFVPEEKAGGRTAEEELRTELTLEQTALRQGLQTTSEANQIMAYVAATTAEAEAVQYTTTQ